MTEWKNLPDWPMYEISDDGQVRRTVQGRNWPAGKIKTPQRMPNGYLQVHLYSGGRCYSRGIHRLLCLAFYGPPPSAEHEAAHRNGARQDNRINNLRWVTKIKNAEDRDDHGRTARGERGGNSKLTTNQVESIRANPEKALQRVLADRFGVSRKTIVDIVTRKTWRHL